MSAARAFLTDLEGQGFRLKADGEQLLCAPVARLTPELRAGIVAHKAELLCLLCVLAPVREALAVRFTGTDAQACWPAIAFYVRAGKLAEARLVASLCGDTEQGRQWLAELSDTAPTTLPALDENAAWYALWHSQIRAGLRGLRDNNESAFWALCEEVEERAGIMEYDGGLERLEAERLAEWQTLWQRFCAPALENLQFKQRLRVKEQ